jgi:ubiquitin-like protein Pup
VTAGVVSNGVNGNAGHPRYRWPEAEVTPMAEREQKKRTAPARREDAEVEAVPATSESGEKIKAELDELLDEIDEVLETNAEDFVKSYVQKGGQ